MASSRPQTLKERFAELIPAEIENVSGMHGSVVDTAHL